MPAMVDGYDPQAIEAKWQAYWAEHGTYEVENDDPRPHWYTLCMYPYPSGAAHMGHVRNYTFGDLIVRYRTMNGYAVLSPMGFDSFGLPAENAAIKTGRHPREFTDERIEQLRSSILRLGAVYDWRRTVTSHSPEYQRWTQWIFLRLLEAGLAYRRSATVNWDPVDQTVLANEQVLPDGTAERSGAVVEKRDLEQWFFRITDYAQQLLDDLDELDWPERVKLMQRNWIGRSEGAEFDMAVTDADGAPLGDATVRVFTTRPDTSFGMTYAVMAPEHPLVASIVPEERRAEVDAFVAEARRASDVERMSSEGSLDKRGIFTGAHLRNPFTGRPVPLYLADYVLMGYGTGAIMAVPAEDQRDWDFAQAHGLPIVRTIQPPEGWEGEAYTGDGDHINSEWLDGLGKAEAIAKAIDFLEAEGIGERKVNFRLRDWLVSRQRFWGCPIPVVYCDGCGIVPVPDDQLRLMLLCCHPALGTEAQVAMTLKLMGGLTTAEIARGLLVPETTMAQRLVRAKRKLRDGSAPYRIPDADALPARLAAVRHAISLIFTEGHRATSGDELVRAPLVEAAIRLARVLDGLVDDPESRGLLALLLLTEARRSGRLDVDGRVVPLSEADRGAWDRGLIAEGHALVRQLLRRGEPGPFQIQAAIAAVHADAPAWAATDWDQVIALYDQLLTVRPGPVVALNRAAAVAERDGPVVALREVASLDAVALDGYQPFHAVRADLLARTGDVADAEQAYDRAIDLSGTEPERADLRRRRAQLASG